MASAGSLPLLIFPFNGNGLEAVDCLGGEFRLLGFVDDTPEKQGQSPYGHAVRPRAALGDEPEARVLAVPGGPSFISVASRRHRRACALGRRTRFARRDSSDSARISPPLATIGHNVLIMAGVVITSNAVIGDHVCVLPNTVIHHDAQIGAWSLVGSNVTVAGSTIIGENCYIGSGSSLMNGMTIGDAGRERFGGA